MCAHFLVNLVELTNALVGAIKLIDDYHIKPCEMYRSVFLPFFRGISTDEGIRELDKVNEKMCAHKKQ